MHLTSTPSAQVGTVDAEQKISEFTGGFGGIGDAFGASVVALGDLDNNGVGDLAVGSDADDDGGTEQGAVWILFLNSDGTVSAEQKISATEGNFGGDLDAVDRFGCAVAALGDLDNNGVGDLAVGAYGDDDGDTNKGAVWILFLEADGTVTAEQKISAAAGNFGGALDAGDQFGGSIAALGDLDNNGVGDLAVGAILDGGADKGAVWILFLNADGTVAAEQKISETEGNFGGALDVSDEFGASVAALSDLDGNGVGDLAVGASGDDDGGTNQGAVWILFLQADGTVAAEQKISEIVGDFGGALDANDNFGFSVAGLSDLDESGLGDLAVGAFRDGDEGATWILFLNPDGTVASEQKINETEGGFGGILDLDDKFGVSVAALSDLDGNGVGDLAVGSSGDDDGGSAHGAAWILFLVDAIPPVITCPGNQFVECTGPASAVVNYSVNATDGQDPTPSVVCVPPSGSTFPLGTTMVSCTAMDESGNSDMCSFDVIVQDTTPPLVTCPLDITLECTNPGGEVVTYSASATDVCDPAPALLYSPPSGSTFPLGTTPVTVTATDGEGNSAMCTFDVTIEDTTPPLLSCPVMVTAIDAKGGPPGEIVFFSVTASDACDATPSVVCLPPPGSFFPRGTTLVLCTATDDSGNQTDCVFPVVVKPTVRRRP